MSTHLMNARSITAPAWMSAVLWAAAVYNIVWGAVVILAPGATLRLLGADPATMGTLAEPMWACVGMIVGVYGIGYACAARDVYRHWPIVLVGLLGKIFGPIGFIDAALIRGVLPVSFGYTILTNDLIWWVPFAMMLWGAARAAQVPAVDRDGLPVPAAGEALAAFKDHTGASLAERSQSAPVLVVFLRHMGCTFCREALADLSARRSAIEAAGAKIALVAMSGRDDALPLLEKHGLSDVPFVTDESGVLYRALGLDRGGFLQLFGPRVWVRGFVAGVLGRHGVGALKGDGFQMPGTFLVSRGAVIQAHRHAHAGERPDYAQLAACPLPAGGAR